MGAIAAVLLVLAGAAVGATSIGGVLVVPVLTAWTSTSLGGAIAASSFAFAFTGAAAFAWPAGRFWPAGTGAKAGSMAGATTAGAAVSGAATASVLEAASAATVAPAVAAVVLASTAAAPAVAASTPAGAAPPSLAAVPAVVATESVGLGGWPLHGCALLGAALGAATLGRLPAGGIRTGIGLLAVATGIHGLWRLRAIAAARPGTESGAKPGRIELGRARLAAIGFGVGCASAWSGTGGPVLLLPLLALFGWRTDRAVAAAQRIQLPVALAATAVHLGAGRLDLRLGLLVGALVLAGWAAGRWLAGRITTRRLAQAVAMAMIGVGLWYLRPI